MGLGLGASGEGPGFVLRQGLALRLASPDLPSRPPSSSSSTSLTPPWSCWSSTQVCYTFPEEEDDHKLLRRQQKLWEPLLAWLKDDFDIHISKPTHLLSTCENSPETIKKMAW